MKKHIVQNIIGICKLQYFFNYLKMDEVATKQ